MVSGGRIAQGKRRQASPKALDGLGASAAHGRGCATAQRNAEKGGSYLGRNWDGPYSYRAGTKRAHGAAPHAHQAEIERNRAGPGTVV